MKKYSDNFSGLSRLQQKVSNRIATTALFLVAVITVTSAQDYTFIEGSVHSFKVENHDGNTFAWSFHDDSFNALDNSYIDYLDGQFDTDVTVRLIDRDRTVSQLHFLAVTETNTHGCSTTRAISILIEANNMYLEFASAETQNCFNMGEYLAPLKVGLNFLDKGAGVAIPENRFPLQVTYQIRNITDGTAVVQGNGGAPLTLEYNDANDYYLLITEAVGELTRTIEYELEITSVIDKEQTVINNNQGDIRLQIRIINHLPQSGGMDMAMAYVLTPINYLGAY